MTRPDHLTVSPSRFVRYAGAVAVAGALAGSLAACGSSSNGSTLSSSTTSASPSASIPTTASAAVAAQAKALLARLHFAEAKLSSDYSWVAAAEGSKTSLSASTVTLFVTQRGALSNAHGAVSNAAHAARAAAQATPRNCAVVASQRQAAYNAYNSGVAAYNSFGPAATAALTALSHTTADRAAVQSALSELKTFADAHPEADVNLGTETGLAFAHSASDDTALTTAVHSAQSSVASTYADLQKLRGNVAQIAPTCG